MKKDTLRFLLIIISLLFQLPSFSQYSVESKFGSDGQGNGQFNSPQAVALDADGNVYVCDAFGGNDRIQKFSSSGVFQSVFGTTQLQNNSPTSIAVDASGNVFVNGGIKFNSSGVFQSTLFSDNTYGTAIDQTGNIYVTANMGGSFSKYSNTGTLLAIYGTAGNGNGQFSNPWGIVVDQSGNIFVADYGNNRIQKFSSSGTYLSQFGTLGSGNGQFNGPRSMAIDASDNLYVVDYNNHRVQVFNNGVYLYHFDISSLENPNSIAINSVTKKIYISNDYTSNRHIAVLAPSPKIDVSVNSASLASGTGYYDFKGLNGGSNAVVTISVRNSGLTNLDISEIYKKSGSSDFSVNTTATTLSLTPGSTTTFTIKFAPTSIGGRGAEFRIKSNDLDIPNYTFSVLGEGLYPSIVVKNNSNALPNGTGNVDFGTTVTNGPALSNSIAIHNTGSANLIISDISGTSGSDDFKVISTSTSLNLEAGQSTFFEVQFYPLSSGPKSAVITISTNDPETPSYTFTVSGTAVLTSITNSNTAASVVNIYPNPSDGLVQVDLNGLTDISKIVIRDVAGKEVYSNVATGNLLTLDLQSFKEGLYYIEFENNKGQKNSRKLIKK